MPDPDDERARGARLLWHAVTARPGRSQLLAAVLLAFLGYAAAVQIQLTRSSDDFAGQRRQDLVELLDSLSGASDRAQQQINQLEGTRDQLASSSSRQSAALANARQRLADLQILAGTAPATGPGVVITIKDPEASVTAASMLNGIEELRDAGAEALQVNHTVRLVASSWVSGTPGRITIDGHLLHAPYVIVAVGSAHTLSDAVGFPGGLSDEIASLGGQVTVQEEGSVSVTALHPAERPQYAQPTGH
jgi:uncharacterized protein YlxW (UPF0749 family)